MDMARVSSLSINRCTISATALRPSARLCPVAGTLIARDAQSRQMSDCVAEFRAERRPLVLVYAMAGELVGVFGKGGSVPQAWSGASSAV